jgi:hypothetical protein
MLNALRKKSHQPNKVNKLFKWKNRIFFCLSLLMDIETNDNNKFAYIFYEFGLRDDGIVMNMQRYEGLNVDPS